MKIRFLFSCWGGGIFGDFPPVSGKDPYLINSYNSEIIHPTSTWKISAYHLLSNLSRGSGKKYFYGGGGVSVVFLYIQYKTSLTHKNIYSNLKPMYIYNVHKLYFEWQMKIHFKRNTTKTFFFAFPQTKKCALMPPGLFRLNAWLTLLNIYIVHINFSKHTLFSQNWFL